jgi:hypothetical protein
MFLTCRVCEAQNLVPNGDFEQYSGCPDNIGQLDSALFWFNPTNATPDYYNQCASGSYVGVPANALGFQYAHSGVAYCGLLTYWGFPNYREYIEIPLTVTLTAGTCYYFQMYISCANYMQYASSNLSIYFSDVIIDNISNLLPLPFIPQINNTLGYITDTLNWISYSANYTASGNENYLIIGNFTNDLSIDTLLLDDSAMWVGAYVFIDDVSLTPCTGIEQQNNNEAINIYPNPVRDKINIKSKTNELAEFILYEVTGRKTIQQSFTSSTSINTEQLAKGIYLYEVRNKNGVIKKGKVVKE